MEDYFNKCDDLQAHTKINYSIGRYGMLESFLLASNKIKAAITHKANNGIYSVKKMFYLKKTPAI